MLSKILKNYNKVEISWILYDVAKIQLILLLLQQ